MERGDIDEKYLWDLNDLFADDDAFLAELAKQQNLPETLASYEGSLDAPGKLLDFMRLQDDAGDTLSKLYGYAARKSDEDTRVSTYQDFQAQVQNLYVHVMSATSWFDNEVLALGKERIGQFAEQEPGLELYKLVFERLFKRAEHVLSPAEEKLLAAAADMASNPDDTFSMLNDADMTFPDAVDSHGEAHPVTHGSFVPLLQSSDRDLRRSAYEGLYSVYGQFKNTSASILAGQMKQLKFFADSRKYASTLEASLDDTEVPTQVYTNLIDAVHKGLPMFHRYIGLRKKVLGLQPQKKLRFYDLYVPMGDEYKMKFTYEEACETMLKALEPMGEEYLSIVRKGLSERWVDVYETPGKRSGAYSAGSIGAHPVILMNFQGELDDVFTLVHEMGHSVHTYLTCQNQPSVYSHYVIFVAEVASTCNEALLMQYLLKNATDDKQKAYLLNHFTEQFRSTLFRQTMFAEFELKVNELAASGAGITAEALCNIYADLNRLYFGDDVEIDEQISLEWSRIPHFYYDYYVYQYATGYAAAIAISTRILEEGETAVADYFRFLSGGNSDTPIELLKLAGVDMASTAPIESALNLFDELIDQLEELL